MKAVVTVVGKDRVGIIANVCTALAGFGVNVLDINQTVMQGYFTMMMVVEVSMCNIPLADLVTKMDDIGKEMGLSIRVQRHQLVRLGAFQFRGRPRQLPAGLPRPQRLELGRPDAWGKTDVFFLSLSRLQKGEKCGRVKQLFRSR